jgi:hypothetical protein
MKSLINYLFPLFLACLAYNGWGQTITGLVEDQHGEPMAFVTIRGVDKANEGWLTDIEGRFTIANASHLTSLKFTYIGFAPVVVSGDDLMVRPLRIVMRPDSLSLPEIEVVAGENPAHRIIRETIARKKNHNPELYPTFTCTIFNKIIIDPILNEDNFRASLEGLDSTALEKQLAKRDTLLERLENQHFLFMENLLERHYERPNRIQDVVLLNRVSGFQESPFLALANAVQPFSFYDDYIGIMETNYLNPLSKGSIGRYRFEISDTLFSGTDTIWVIRYEPSPNATFDGLKGMLHIHGGDFALKNVRAEPAKPIKIMMLLEQQYQRTPEGKWFPEQLRFEMSTPNYPSPQMGLKVYGSSFIKSVHFAEIDAKNVFDPERPLYVLPEAFEQADSLWNPYRQDGFLSKKEATTYHIMDSIGREANMDVLSRLMDITLSGAWSFSDKIPVNLDVNRLFAFNFYENIRLGLGLTTRPERSLVGPSQRVEANAYFGYGFKDRGWKYGGEVMWRVHRPSYTRLMIGYHNDLSDAGALYEKPTTTTQWSRNFYSPLMDRVEAWHGGFETKPFPYLKLQGSLIHQRLRPGYDYQYIDPEGITQASYFLPEVQFRVHFEQFSSLNAFGGSAFNKSNRIPRLIIGYTRSMDQLFNSAYQYERWVASLGQDLMVRGMGKLKWSLDIGKTTGNAPLSRLFTVIRPANGYQYLWLPGIFQTNPNTFLYDRFVQFSWLQELGYLLWQTTYSRPMVALSHLSITGALDHPERHQNISTISPQSVFSESGLILHHLYKVNYLNIADLSIGAGFFVPYGPGIDRSFQRTAPRVTIKFVY